MDDIFALVDLFMELVEKICLWLVLYDPTV